MYSFLLFLFYLDNLRCHFRPILYLVQFYANVIFLSRHCKQNIKLIAFNLKEKLKSNKRKLAKVFDLNFNIMSLLNYFLKAVKICFSTCIPKIRVSCNLLHSSNGASVKICTITQIFSLS
jgi:hypothetical protein